MKTLFILKTICSLKITVTTLKKSVISYVRNYKEATSHVWSKKLLVRTIQWI